MRSKFPAAAAATVGAIVLAAGCGSSHPNPSAGPASGGGRPIAVVAGENQYGNVASQIGGPYVSVYSVESNPNTDPHTYEATPSVAQKVAKAKLLVVNGLGYDGFMTRLASASPNRARKVINVQKLLGLPDATNPHLWYDPTTMPAVARALVSDLSSLDPGQAAYFRASGARFVASLQPWLDAIAAFKAEHGGVKAATTEPIANHLLTAMGIDNLSPSAFQADIMNGTDPSPQDVSLENSFLTRHRAKFLCYNQQVTDSLTGSIRRTAVKAGVPVVGMYETMPTPGYDYQSWMLAEVAAIGKAIASGASTEHL